MCSSCCFVNQPFGELAMQRFIARPLSMNKLLHQLTDHPVESAERPDEEDLEAQVLWLDGRVRTIEPVVRLIPALYRFIDHLCRFIGPTIL